MHAAAPLTEENVPGPHADGAVAPVEQLEPAGQSSQSEAAVLLARSEYEPASHGSCALAPRLQYEPDLHESAARVR